MSGIRVEDQLCVGQILLKVKGIDGVEDDVGLATNNEDWDLDVFEIGETFTYGIAPLGKSSELRCLNFVVDRSIAILYSRIPALEKGPTSSLTLRRRREEAVNPEVIDVPLLV